MITIIKGDDWGGVYVDGILVDQGHEWGYNVSTVERLMKIMDLPNVEVVEVDTEWLAEAGWLPVYLEEVKTWD